MMEHNGSGNVFFEMGFEDWKECTAKAEIVIEIASLIKEKGPLT